MKARLELDHGIGGVQRLRIILPAESGLEEDQRWAQVVFLEDTKSIGHALARLLDWMVRNTDV